MSGNDINILARALEIADRRNSDLAIANGSLTAEVGMLKEALERSENDRIRLQAVSSTLVGQLLAINAVIAEAMRTAIKNGIEAAAEVTKDPELEQAAQEAQEIIQRVEPVARPEDKVRSLTSPRAPLAAVGAMPPPVDWRRPEPIRGF